MQPPSLPIKFVDSRCSSMLIDASECHASLTPDYAARTHASGILCGFIEMLPDEAQFERINSHLRVLAEQAASETRFISADEQSHHLVLKKLCWAPNWWRPTMRDGDAF